ncbi:MAG: hypothetical protein ACKPKO_34365, partial [Candidatus Fonsibacter sp.]
MGFFGQFNSVHHKSIVVAVRVALTVAKDFRAKAWELKTCRDNTLHLYRAGKRKEWYESSFYFR